MKYLFFPIFSRLGVYQIGLTLALCAISGSACSDRRNDPEPTFLGGQTGDEGGSQYARRAGTATKTCDFEESVFDRTATTIYGTSIDELMARFQTIESVPFHWQNYSWGDSVQVSSAGVTSLQLWPDIDKGTVYEIRLKPLDGSDGHRHCDAVWYEVPVQMHWSTADGALHEVQRSQTIDRSSLEVRPEGRRRDPPPTFTPPVVLTVLSPNVAHFQHRFELSTLNGSLALTSDEVRWDSASLDANAWLYRGGSHGRLELQLEGLRRLGNVSTISNGACGGSVEPCNQGTSSLPTAARPTPDSQPVIPDRTRYVGVWPSALACNNAMSPLSPTAKLSELSATQVLKLIAEAPSLVRRNSPNARVTLNFDPLPNELCQSTAGAGLLFVATATVAKGGLGAELRLSLRVDASLNRLGKLSTIELSREHWLQPLTSAQLLALGLEVADADSYQDLYLQWTVTYTRETQGWAGLGALRVYGRNPDPGCLAARAELADTPAAPVSSLSCGRTKAVYDESEGIYLPPGTQLLEVNYESTP